MTTAAAVIHGKMECKATRFLSMGKLIQLRDPFAMAMDARRPRRRG